MEGGHTRLEPKVTTTSADLKLDRWKLQFGVDLSLAEAMAGGQLVGGLTAHYGEASADVDSRPSASGPMDRAARATPSRSRRARRWPPAAPSA